MRTHLRATLAAVAAAGSLLLGSAVASAQPGTPGAFVYDTTAGTIDTYVGDLTGGTLTIMDIPAVSYRVQRIGGAVDLGFFGIGQSSLTVTADLIEFVDNTPSGSGHGDIARFSGGGMDLVIVDEYGNTLTGTIDLFELVDRSNAMMPGIEGQARFTAVSFSGPTLQNVPTDQLATISTVYMYGYASQTLEEYLASGGSGGAELQLETFELRIEAEPFTPKSCCEWGKLRILTMQYTGDDCTASNHQQEPGKVFCDGDPQSAPQVYIISCDKDDPTHHKAKIWFEGLVDLGGTYDIDATNAGQSRLKGDTFIHIFDTSGLPLQTLRFHTSCSQPIDTGDQFGSALIVDCVGEEEPVPGDCCADGDLVSLTLQYTGDDCSATHHAQDPRKVSCDGDPMFLPQAYIRASDKEDPDNPRAKVWFEDVVNLGATYELVAANGGAATLKAATFIHVFDLDQNLLQTIKFHTSCSQMLVEGDQFGSALVVGCVGEDRPVKGDLCNHGAKPQRLTMKYAGGDCSATSHFQHPRKVSCDGDPMDAPVVWILATDKSNPDRANAKIWFSGSVPLGGLFDIDATKASQTRLRSNTYLHIFDATGETLLQTVKFHTSCSQPLVLGDQYGAAQLIEFVTE
ncbi:MAG: hypothetical protein KAS72_08895 [Phycisphaerales bacterium]|nr:hypothetical protein [Phycisphaerales bacterium]